MTPLVTRENTVAQGSRGTLYTLLVTRSGSRYLSAPLTHKALGHQAGLDPALADLPSHMSSTALVPAWLVLDYAWLFFASCSTRAALEALTSLDSSGYNGVTPEHGEELSSHNSQYCQSTTSRR